MKDGEVKNKVLCLLGNTFPTSYQNRTDILYLYAPNLVSVSDDQFNSTALVFIFLPKLKIIGLRGFNGNYSLTDAYIPNLEIVERFAL
jgi:hypothetical protein